MRTSLQYFQWLYQRPSGEPKGPYGRFLFGVFLIIIGGVLTITIGLWKGPPTFRTSSRCREQQTDLQRRQEELNQRRKTSANRTVEFNKALSNPENPAFVGARTAISFEENLTRDFEREQKSLEVETLGAFLPLFAIGLLLVVLIALMAARLAAWQGLAAVGAWSRSGEWKWRTPYWLAVVLVFGAHAAREIFTSILTTKDKSWFAWSSFCISSGAWGLMLVVALGFAMIVAYPATILWHFGSRSNRPTTLDWTHRDGQWGVGSYVLFLQTWAILSFVFLIVPVALWLKALINDPRLSRAYLLTSSVLFVSVLAISGRMVRNAIAIRRTYHAELRRLGKTWQDIQEKKPPPDPTSNFLGDHWWKLPTVILGTFALLWLIVEKIGVSDLLIKLSGIN